MAARRNFDCWASWLALGTTPVRSGSLPTISSFSQRRRREPHAKENVSLTLV